MNERIDTRFHTALLTGVSVLAPVAMPAVAADTADRQPERAVLEVVTVTAQRREE